MLFNSWAFLCLLAVTLPLYYLPLPLFARRVWQVLLLLVASAVFYAWENPKLLILLGSSCAINVLAVERILYFRARRMVAGQSRNDGGSSKSHSDAARFEKRWLVGAIVSNLGFLAFFKYFGFLCGLLPAGWLPSDVLKFAKEIPLPVGISFYTFQGISLVVDVWRREISPEACERFARSGFKGRIVSFRDLSFYISFFPQLVAGPIVKARDFVDQIGVKLWRNIDWPTVRRSLILGYFLKIFVADNLAEQTAGLTVGVGALDHAGAWNLLPLLYGYSFQIFADFAGYSLIAIGLGALFGYRLPENFRFPYLSISITEFWRRWHITLSAWLRDYLYIPLGGNRKGPTRTYVNLFLVMFLGGLWHGAEWKFAMWGTLHGVLLAAERLVFRRHGRMATSPVVSMESGGHNDGAASFGVMARSVFGWFYAFNAATFLWLSFMMPDMASIRAFFEGLFSDDFSMRGPPMFSLLFYGGWVVAYHLWGWISERRKEFAVRLHRPWLEGALHGLMLFLIATNPGAPRGFIYFQF